ncbi:hypothetical protein CAXC1_330093 [Candidatus Xenohaliotis californiensis]|uniref:Uncharacterized protein n=1 Tax=Candidatus Xenohaliotis californiensis TaxID=84677 RepID=A0ABM9N9M7_9RICK|nr:hypothetical protein CAXC1_330093 [Candidatus Xenohaliotis californiensis]
MPTDTLVPIITNFVTAVTDLFSKTNAAQPSVFENKAQISFIDPLDNFKITSDAAERFTSTSPKSNLQISPTEDWWIKLFSDNKEKDKRRLQKNKKLKNPSLSLDDSEKSTVTTPVSAR